jgi:hypothetical protein
MSQLHTTKKMSDKTYCLNRIVAGSAAVGGVLFGAITTVASIFTEIT